MRLLAAFTCGSLIFGLLMPSASPSVDPLTAPDRGAGAERQDGQQLRDIHRISPFDREALVEELLQPREEGGLSRPGHWLPARRHTWPLLQLGHPETLIQTLEDYRAPHVGVRRRLADLLSAVQHVDLVVLLVDDLLFVDEEIDWAEIDADVRHRMKSLPLIAGEQLARFILREVGTERFDPSALDFIRSMNRLLRAELDGLQVPAEAVIAFRQFWNENRGYFLAEDYERVFVPKEVRDVWKTYRHKSGDAALRDE